MPTVLVDCSVWWTHCYCMAWDGTLHLAGVAQYKQVCHNWHGTPVHAAMLIASFGGYVCCQKLPV